MERADALALWARVVDLRVWNSKAFLGWLKQPDDDFNARVLSIESGALGNCAHLSIVPKQDPVHTVEQALLDVVDVAGPLVGKVDPQVYFNG